MRCAFEGAIAIASRPYGFFGKPLFASGVISVQVFPPSVERNNPLAEGAVGLSPPERYSQPLRRKSHIVANMISGFVGSIARSVQPVERIAPQRARHGCEDSVAASRIHHDPRNALRFLQASPRPRFTAIGRLIDSFANGNGVARPRLTSADPHVFRIFRVERDGADRLNALFVEYRAVARRTIIRFANTSAGRANKKRDFARWLGCTRDGGDASAHCCRANITRAQAGDACRIKWRNSGVNRNSANKERCEKASSLKGITCEIHKGANSVLCKLTAVVGRYLFGLENEIL